MGGREGGWVGRHAHMPLGVSRCCTIADNIATAGRVISRKLFQEQVAISVAMEMFILATSPIVTSQDSHTVINYNHIDYMSS